MRLSLAGLLVLVGGASAAQDVAAPCPADGVARLGRSRAVLRETAERAALHDDERCRAKALALADWMDREGRENCLCQARLDAIDVEGDADLLALRGWFAWRCGHPEAAHFDARRALDVDDRAALGWTLLGRALAARYHDADARLAFVAAYAIDPDDPETLLGVAATATTRAERIRVLRHYATTGALRGEPRERLRAASESADFTQALGDRELFKVERADLPRELEIEPLALAPGRVSGLTVGIEVGAGRRVRALFDTGASGFHVDDRAAKDAGVERISAVTLVGGGGSGEHDAGRGILDVLDLGAVRYREALATVAPGGLHPQGAYRALFGPDLFGTTRVTISVRDARIVVETSESPPGASDPRDVDPWIADPALAPVISVEGMLLIPASIAGPRGTRTRSLFLLDTGAARSYIDVDLALELGAIRREDGRSARGYGGEVALLGQVPRLDLTIAGATGALREVPVFSLESRARVAGIHVGGFVGLDWMQDKIVEIDFGRGTVRVTDVRSRRR